MEKPFEQVGNAIQNIPNNVQTFVESAQKGGVTALIAFVALFCVGNIVTLLIDNKVFSIIIAGVTLLLGGALLYYCENRKVITVGLIVAVIALSTATIVLYASCYDEEGLGLGAKLGLMIPYGIIALYMFFNVKSLCKPDTIIRTNPIVPRQPLRENIDGMGRGMGGMAPRADMYRKRRMRRMKR